LLKLKLHLRGFVVDLLYNYTTRNTTNLKQIESLQKIDNKYRRTFSDESPLLSGINNIMYAIEVVEFGLNQDT